MAPATLALLSALLLPAVGGYHHVAAARAALLPRFRRAAPLRPLLMADDATAATEGAPADAAADAAVSAAPAAAVSRATSTQEYLSSLTRLADDGRSLLQAPQRYSSRQWRSNLATLASCNILRAIRGQLVWQCLWALFISALYICSRGVPTLPALPHSLLGGVLGVLLGFRTNQSYDRFWEGRKLWGQCFTSCRCIARSSLAYIDSDLETYSTLLRYLKAFPVALKQHLRGERDFSDFAGTLESRELNELLTADNLPLSVSLTTSDCHPDDVTAILMTSHCHPDGRCARRSR